MKHPSRAMVNGTSTLLAVIALILITMMCIRGCGPGKNTRHDPPSVVSQPTDTTEILQQPDDTISVRESNSKKGSRRKKGSATRHREPNVYPQRSPLDEPVTP